MLYIALISVGTSHAKKYLIKQVKTLQTAKREFPTYFEVNKTIILPLLIWILYKRWLKNLCLQL